ncbi:hypothetical protein B0A49_08579 [Cryomyces minteri]|uniref:CST complex subunit Stn1 N-terminal domain-containing protein n=1 Tax=Cryomyces minteri TaxID=331657 RepID=A0A4U0WUA4_9PEZI|nr:hypothetical protein B0A49_08579 [Cryomyces minteri]
MTPRASAPPAHIYPAHCFTASPTYNAWVKLTAADVHALRAEPGFEGQNVFFHLNHPVRYVRLVAAIVAIDDLGPRYTLLTIDDGSGATIEIKITRLDTAQSANSTSPLDTEVENVKVKAQLGGFDVLVDGKILDIGTVIKARCTLGSFRGVRQLELKRVALVHTTDEEAQAWADLADFKQDVLSKPWVLTSAELKNLEDEVNGERRKLRERVRRRQEYEAKKAEKRRRHEERVEKRRRKEEQKITRGALDWRR